MKVFKHSQAVRAAFFVAFLAVPAGSFAQAAVPTLTAEAVQKILAAAVAKARAIKVPMGISVVDESGSLVGFIKMDGAFVHTNYTSFSKAYTAASVRKPTHEMGIPPAIAAEIQATTGGRFTVLPGGVPIVIDGKVVGGIGVGGGNGEQDVTVARAGADAVTR